MMGMETMKSVSPKTVDRSTLVQRSSVRLDPAAPREDTTWTCLPICGVTSTIYLIAQIIEEIEIGRAHV